MKTSSNYSEYLKKNKKVLYPAALFLLGIILILFVVFPQISAISTSKQDAANKSLNIQNLEASLATISSQSDLTPDADLVNTALPASKNIAIIFNSLLSAAGASGTQIEEFSLKVGGVYGRAAEATAGVEGVPFIGVIARVSGGDANNIVNFSNEVQKRLPLAEVVQIDMSGDIATFQISFFYKPQDIAAMAGQNIVKPLNSEQKELLEELRTWDR